MAKLTWNMWITYHVVYCQVFIEVTGIFYYAYNGRLRNTESYQCHIFILSILIRRRSCSVPFTLHHYALKRGQLYFYYYIDNRFNIIFLLDAETYFVPL